jgi:cbb3-type cytochrome oxidase subunit 1
MPPITRLFIKASLLYLVAALLVGLLLALRGLLNLLAIVGGLTPVYFHLFMVGWVTQIIAGVAYWMFPKWSRQRPRGYDGLALATFWLLNLGLLLRVVAEPAQTVSAWPGWGWLIVAAALLQWLAGMAFVANTWPRVKEK